MVSGWLFDTLDTIKVSGREDRYYIPKLLICNDHLYPSCLNNGPITLSKLKGGQFGSEGLVLLLEDTQETC